MSHKNETIKSNLACTFHHDGTVSYWDIYKQQWDRMNAGSIRSSVLSSLNDNERVRINNMIIIDKEEDDGWVTPTDEDAKRRPMVEVRLLGDWHPAKLLAVVEHDDTGCFVVDEYLDRKAGEVDSFQDWSIQTYALCRMKASERNRR